MKIFSLLGPVLFFSVLLFTGVSWAEDNCYDVLTQLGNIARSGAAPDVTISAYRKVAVNCPEVPEAHYNLGIALLNQNQTTEAENSFKKALELREDTRFRIGLGNTKLRQKEVEEAESEFAGVLLAEPDNQDAKQGLAAVANLQGDSDKAVELLSGISGKEKDADYQYNLAILYLGQGKMDEAMATFKKVLELKPGSPEAAEQLAKLYLQTGAPSSAETVLQDTIKANPLAEDRLRRLLGEILTELGRPEEAEKNIRAVLEQSPNDPAAHTDLAVLLLKQGKTADAKEAAKKAVSLDSSNSRAASVYGWSLLENKNYTEAEAALRQALRIDPKESSAHNNLGVLYSRQGKMEDAAREYKAALEIDPKFDSAKKNLSDLEHPGSKVTPPAEKNDAEVKQSSRKK